MSEHSFGGLYRGLVLRTDDPENRGRVQVKVPDLNGDGAFDWALPCIPPTGASLVLPALGAPVWVMFEHGDPDHPVWLGSWRP